MIKTNITHQITNANPISYTVYFSKEVYSELDRILETNFGNTTLSYQKWKILFTNTVQWIRQIFSWFSLFSYGWVNGSTILPNNLYRTECEYGIATYRIQKAVNSEIFILIEHIIFKPFGSMIMESKNNVISITESQLRRIIRESIKKVLNII